MKTLRLRVFPCLFGTALVVALAAGSVAVADTLTVDPSDPGAYQTIGDALAAAGPGDAVIVEAATYNESIVITQANLTLEGEDLPILDGACAETSAIEIAADGVTVTGFEIRNFENGIEAPDGTAGSVISQNVIIGAKDSISLEGAIECEVVENAIQGGDACNEVFESDDGISLEGGQDNIVSENVVEIVGDKGIVIEEVGAAVTGNDLVLTGGDSIRVDGDDNEFLGNSLVGSGSDGFDINNDGNLVEANVVVGSDDEGFDIDGAGNTFVDNGMDANGDDAMELDSDSPGGNILVGNVATGDAEDGFDIESPNNLLVSNRASGNGENGFRLELFIEDGVPISAGDRNTLIDNVAEGNTENGFLLDNVQQNDLTDNRALGNGLWGFSDNSGPDASSVLNTYADNACAGNGLGGSNPPGLCD